MNNEQIERNFEVIVTLQARFAEDLTRLEEDMTRLEGNLVKLTDVTSSLAAVSRRHDEEIAALDKELKTRRSELDASLKELAEAGKETEARLNALILMFERSLGKAKPGDPPFESSR